MARLNEMCKRVRKLLDMFDTVESFARIAASTIDGIDAILERFTVLRDRFRSRQYDFLDWSQEVRKAIARATRITASRQCRGSS